MHRLNRICKNCGLTYGSHNATTCYSEFYNMTVPSNYCPGHEERMDWDKGPGTLFEPTDEYEAVPYGTPARNKIEYIYPIQGENECL